MEFSDIQRRPNLPLEHERFAAQVRAAGLPEIFGKMYGRVSIVRPEDPYNANETGNTKFQDMYGVPSAKPKWSPRTTQLDVYGALGGANPSVSRRYVAALKDADRLKIPGIFAQIYNSPAVLQTREPFDVSQGKRDPALGIVGRIYAGRTPQGQAAAEQARSAADKLKQWIKNGRWE